MESRRSGMSSGVSPRWRKPTSCASTARNRPVIGNAILHSNKRSSCSWRVRIALNLKEIPYDIKPINLETNSREQHGWEFREINPMKHVPALRIDNHTLIGSLNILLYLEETRPHRPLLPVDPVKKARVREICEVIVSGIQPLQNVLVLDYVGEARKLEWAKHWITRGFRAIEKLLMSSAGKYCFGNTITLADCCLVPQIYSARRFNVDLSPYPTMLRVERKLQNNSAFTASHPNNHPDCPGEAVHI